jgi:hypothetical protein
MVLGDFNCIISDLDTKSGNMATSNNFKLILENIMDTLNVVDTFRYKYPNILICIIINTSTIFI